MSGIVVLTGGVGGAKLVHGLALAEPQSPLIAIVNTGDDFRHFGLHVSPDIDTTLYTLSGRANRAQGWGRAEETWNFMAALSSLGEEDWFQLGDGDLALHVARTARLAGGAPLSAIIAAFARAWNIGAQVLPATDDSLATMLDTDEGELDFQTYFVARRCRPVVRRVRFVGADVARPAPGVLEAIAAAEAVLIAPSNPYLSIDPILAVHGIREALERTSVPVVAVSPLIGGRAVKGPTDKLMSEFGRVSDNAAIAAHYAPLIDALLINRGDIFPHRELVVAEDDTLMMDDEARARVARAALALARRISK